jgi:hypothetical protein
LARAPRAGESFAMAAASGPYFLRMALFQWFLIALSDRPPNSFAISAHRLPN